MRSLWLKIIGAFTVVILIGIMVNIWLISRNTRTQFDLYITQSGHMMVEQLLPELENYYQQNGSWSGVDRLLANPWGGWRGGRGMMHGMGGMMHSDGDIWTMMGVRLLLTDANGNVIADSIGPAVGVELNTTDLDAGLPIYSGSMHVGTLLPISRDAVPGNAASSFLEAMRRSIWMAGLVAILVALLLGVLIFRQIIAPVRQLTDAAENIAAGNFNQRVPVRTKDEIGQLASTFNHMAEALEENQQFRSNLIADVAHELRTPISVLQGNLEAMIDGVIPSSPEEIAVLRDESALLVRLVEDLRLISTAESGQLELNRSFEDPETLLERVVESQRLQAVEMGITLLLKVREDLPEIWVDEYRFAQILRNLLDNALRHTPMGGQVTVLADLFEGDTDTEFVKIAVVDTGAGIPEADLPYVFERFYRADRSRSRATGGSGIGLSIVHQLINAHGGRVWVESVEGEGATFIFTIPVKALTDN